MSKQGRSDKFIQWLKEPTKEKVDLLVNLERAVRLVAHVKTLTGTTDDKLVMKMIGVSEQIREAYEPIVLEEVHGEDKPS
jgi:hypothetical protein